MVVRVRNTFLHTGIRYAPDEMYREGFHRPYKTAHKIKLVRFNFWALAP
jgi:hypothetical protein